MKKAAATRIRSILLMGLLGFTGSSHALTSDGANGSPSSLVVTVFDPATTQTFYKDLGITQDKFLAQPTGVFNLALEPHYSAFVGKTNLIYNVGAHHALNSDQSNANSWGVLLSAATEGHIFATDWVGIDRVRQTIQIYFSYLTGPSGIFNAGTPGAFNSNQWNGPLWNRVAGSTTGTVGSPLAFYFVTNPTGYSADGLIRKAGDWILAADGTLTFTGRGSLLQNKPPIANAGGNTTTLAGKEVTLHGDQSVDPDESPAPLCYQWKQIAGTSVNLINPNSISPRFTANDPGLYTFTLTVSDGKDSASDNGRVVIKSLIIKAPNSIKVGTKTAITWQFSPSLFDPTQSIRLSFSADGSTYRPIATGKISRGSLNFKPSSKLVTMKGTLKLCTLRTAQTPEVCDQLAIAIVK
jgi:hypothetical protein